ncbi:unnamed protein product [Ilex paraguariensis]|uniref:Uncharacterized protein n=1 Tax=Ilex paraguariensis TaxID=185542 RepID=A0ABC8T4M4_9AQUA
MAARRYKLTDTQYSGPSSQYTTKSGKSTTRASSSLSRWKSVLNSLAKQFSQVPLSLGIRIASLRGTMRLHIRPPPSDQLWFGFKSMPCIDFNLESFVGDHKISSGHIAQFLISRFKAAIRESMVHPNYENISIPWMLAEKDDWVPRKDAPFIWIKQAAVSDPTTAHEVASSQPGDKTHVIQPSRRATGNNVEDKHDKAKEVEHVRQPIGESPDTHASSSSLTNQATLNDKPSQQLRAPLLANDDPHKTRQGCEEENSGCQTPTRSLMLVEEQNHFLDGDDTRTKTTGTRAKMLSFGKKVGAKFDEKRRHIEERSRHIAEKMRGPQN